jgi:hypothetical protein
MKELLVPFFGRVAGNKTGNDDEETWVILKEELSARLGIDQGASAELIKDYAERKYS